MAVSELVSFNGGNQGVPLAWSWAQYVDVAGLVAKVK